MRRKTGLWKEDSAMCYTALAWAVTFGRASGSSADHVSQADSAVDGPPSMQVVEITQDYISFPDTA